MRGFLTGPLDVAVRQLQYCSHAGQPASLRLVQVLIHHACVFSTRSSYCLSLRIDPSCHPMQQRRVAGPSPQPGALGTTRVYGARASKHAVGVKQLPSLAQPCHAAHGDKTDQSWSVRDDVNNNSEASTSYDQGPLRLQRRAACSLLVGAALAANGVFAPHARASSLPAFADNMWEAMGGGPADLFFPEEFMGTWVSAAGGRRRTVSYGPMGRRPGMRARMGAQGRCRGHVLAVKRAMLHAAPYSAVRQPPRQT